MKKTIFISAVTLFFFASCNNDKPANGSQDTVGDSVPAPPVSIEPAAPVNTAVRYQCPMDCEHGKIYDTLGHCPVCKMDLRKVK